MSAVWARAKLLVRAESAARVGVLFIGWGGAGYFVGSSKLVSNEARFCERFCVNGFVLTWRGLRAHSSRPRGANKIIIAFSHSIIVAGERAVPPMLAKCLPFINS